MQLAENGRTLGTVEKLLVIYRIVDRIRTMTANWCNHETIDIWNMSKRKKKVFSFATSRHFVCLFVHSSSSVIHKYQEENMALCFPIGWLNSAKAASDSKTTQKIHGRRKNWWNDIESGARLSLLKQNIPFMSKAFESYKFDICTTAFLWYQRWFIEALLQSCLFSVNASPRLKTQPILSKDVELRCYVIQSYTICCLKALWVKKS